ncbi:MAG: hypothetical protein R3B70_28785 [Polyangiaceae bacterium]
MHRLAERMTGCGPTTTTVPQMRSPAPDVPRRPFYTPEQRLHALEGQFMSMELPHTLRSFIRDMGSVVLGQPWDTGGVLGPRC